jgi:AraC-like DNA-binding protein
LSLFLLSVNSKNRVSNKLLVVFLLLIAIDYSTYFHSLFITKPFSSFVIAKNCLDFFQMPILYLYVMSVCYSDFKLKPKHLLHTIPFILVNIVLYHRFYSLSVPELFKIWENHNSIWELRYFHISIHLQFLIYITLIFLLLRKYKKIYLQNFSASAFNTYKWLFQFTFAFAIVKSVIVLQSILKYFFETSDIPIMQLIYSITGLIVICWYVLKALKHPDLFNPVDSTTQIIDPYFGVSKTNNFKEVEKLNLFMKVEKPYLNPSLSIRNLAEEFKMSSRDLSILINQNLDKHFFDFVNEYRIEEAKKILQNPNKKEFTVLEILYEVGFNSKSSFNTAFKKHTGLTPTKFRQTA